MRSSTLKKAAARTAKHLSSRRDWRPPTWLLYLLGGFGLACLLYGGIQQYRAHAKIKRWSRLIVAAKERIATLEAEREQARYRAVAQATTRAVAAARKREKGVEQKLGELKRRQQNANKAIQKMTPLQLKQAFEREGF